MKILHCRDAGFDCAAVFEGQTAEDVLEQVKGHAEDAHGLELDDATERQIRRLMRDG